MSEPVRIAMWSGPRNLSTALMRAFENRPDTSVVDEPFYGAYLHLTGIDHPMREEVLAATLTDWRDVIAALGASPPVGPPAPSPAPAAPGRPGSKRRAATIVYEKHITTHMLPRIDVGFMAERRNAFLIRSPERVLASYGKRREQVTFADIGFARQAELFDRVADRLGAAPPVVDAEDILADPPGMLRSLCGSLGIAFDGAMLAWPPGPRAADGVWAPVWYEAVESSTGFSARSATPPRLSPRLRALAEEARPFYQALARHRIVPSASKETA